MLGVRTKPERGAYNYSNGAGAFAESQDEAPHQLDSAFDVDKIKKEISPHSRILDLFGWSTMNASYFIITCGLCLAQPKDERDLRRFRKFGYRRLNSFVRRLTRKEMQLLDLRLLMWCCLSLISYFQEVYRKSKGCNSFLLKRKLSRSRDLLHYVLDLEMPEKQREIVRFSISYFNITWQWEFEEFVLFVFQELIAVVTKPEYVLCRLIKAIEVCQREGNLEQAQMMTMSLAIILDNLYLDKFQYSPKLQKCFNTLLKLYLLNDLDASKSTNESENDKFQSQIKHCIRFFIHNNKDVRGVANMMDSVSEIMLDPDVPDDEQNYLMEMILHCAQNFHARLYRESITPRVVKFLLSYLKSDSRSSAMASHKIFHYILDRHNNLMHFTEPIYHFKGRTAFLVNVEYSREDVHFFKSFSQDFFGGIYKCLNKYTETTNLISSYTTICIVLVEVPDPVTTINMIHVVIKTQNNILKNEGKYDTIVKYHIHAVIASVLSLICLIHEDEVIALGKYVQEVVDYRNENSPHLLPPLCPEYNIAKHHTTGYHQRLYFLEKEVLYALKQCWLGRRRSN